MGTNISDIILTAPDGIRYIRPHDAAQITGLKLDDTSYLIRAANYRQYRLVDGDNDVAKTVQTIFVQDVPGDRSNGTDLPPVAMFKAEDIEKILHEQNAE